MSRTNWVERGAAAQQEQFYRIGMRARDRRGGAICVGTNAVYRRSALDERGGMALLEHSEDLFTGMKVIDAGYRVTYLPVVLAAGSAPTTTQALASQQYRWARGNFALSSTPMFKRLQLSPMQRLSIWDGWIFYITSALSPVVAVLVPLLTLAEAPEAISFAPALWLVPSLVTEFVLQPRWLILNDGRASRRVGLISQIAHLDALRDHLTDREQEWIPTGGIQAGKHRQATDRIPDLISAGGLCGFLGTLTLVGMRLADGYSLVDLAPVVVLALHRPADRAGRHTSARPPPGGAPDQRRARSAARHRAGAVDHPRAVLARARLLVDLVDVRRDAGGVLRVGCRVREERVALDPVAVVRSASATVAAAVRRCSSAMSLVAVLVADPRRVPNEPRRRRQLDRAVPQPRAAAVGGRVVVDAAVVPAGADPRAADRAGRPPSSHHGRRVACGQRCGSCR